MSLLVVLAAVGLVGGAASLRAAAPGPTLVAAPATIGATIVDQRLTAEPGTWSGSGTISYHFQWYRCDANGAHCSSVHGATAQSYKLVPADATHTIGLTVVATGSTGSTSAYASLVGPIAAASSAFVSTVQPVVTGTVTTGAALQVSDGAWSQTPASLLYAWLRCNANGRICAQIANATANTYTATADDVGHALVASVTATAGTGTQTALSTAATAASTTGTGTTPTPTPTPGPTNSVAPTVSGSAAQGAQLTGTAGSWSGSGTITFGYQWYRCDTTGAHCSSIHGATAATYKLVAADVAHTMGLTVNATDSKGKTSAYASLVGPISTAGTALIASAQPIITGGTAVGSALAASSGAWTAPPTSYDYAWQRCNANGRICTPIAGATSATYTATAADAGHQLVVLVQAVSGNTTAETLSKSVTIH